MFDFDEDMKLTFLEEAQSLLDDTEAAFMALDDGDRSAEMIDKIFRLAHNFKSSAKTVGLAHLSDFGHVFEDLLTKIKNGSVEPDKQVCTILLETLDELKKYVAGLKADLTYQHDTTIIVEILKALIETADETASAPATVPVTVSTPVAVSAPVAEIVSAPEPVAEPIAPSVPVAPPSVPASAPVAPAKSTEEENIKVNRRKLDGLLNLIGELVVNQSMMTSHKVGGTLDSEQSIQTLNAIEKIVHDIQDLSLLLRMSPIAPLFQKLKRIARDASSGLQKTITFVTEGEHVEVDKIVMDRISDPLTHLVRNAVDHGVETDAERATTTKTDQARIVLKAQQQEDRIIITLTDNGRGMNPDKLRAKAIEKGLISANQELTEAECVELIFKPGFSTKEQVTDMSGRGVGMDVVKRAVEDLKGSIRIETKLGEGTSFIISLPLSMSIFTGMVVAVDKQKYVVPISQLVETVELSKFQLETSTGSGRMFNLRGDVIPVYSLSRILHAQPEAKKPGTVLITYFEGKKVSFEIDEICGQQKIVLKKVGREMEGLPGIVAGAILSTGEPGLVLNLNEFIEQGHGHAA